MTGPEIDWRPELKAMIRGLENDIERLDPRSPQMLREDLCTQLEREALSSKGLLIRQILFTAVKRLELKT